VYPKSADVAVWREYYAKTFSHYERLSEELKIKFEEIIRALNYIGYRGPLSVEWEDSAMDREQGAEESCRLVKHFDFMPSSRAFDAGFEKK
jgi:sugar phosphate isomerase/epimerase